MDGSQLRGDLVLERTFGKEWKSNNTLLLVPGGGGVGWVGDCVTGIYCGVNDNASGSTQHRKIV